VYEQVGDITPIDVERVFDDMFLFPNMPECTGTIDRIQGNMRTKDVDILDYKSGKQATKADLNSSIQATMYSLAFKQMYGFYPRRFIFVYTKLKKTRDIIITPDFIERGTSRIIDIWGHMARGEFDPPEKPNKYFCQHFCEKTVGCPRMKRPKGWEQV
jgi:CRISPR/Cas system-associated exonuclease Cas4 (RecB family)